MSPLGDLAILCAPTLKPRMRPAAMADRVTTCIVAPRSGLGASTAMQTVPLSSTTCGGVVFVAWGAASEVLPGEVRSV